MNNIFDCELVKGVTDYDSFRYIEANRRFVILGNSGNVVGKRRNLMLNIKHGWLISPIVCFIKDGFYVIVDGQHRVQICKYLGKPISLLLYSNSDGSELSNEQVDYVVKAANCFHENWRDEDHLKWDSEFNDDECAAQLLHARMLYDYIDKVALGWIINGERTLLPEDIKSRSLSFDPPNHTLLREINDLTRILITRRKSAGYVGLRKDIVNYILYHFIVRENIDLVLLRDVITTVKPENISTTYDECNSDIIVAIANFKYK